MKRFAALYEELDATNKTLPKIAALERYFREAEAGDAAHALALLTGRTQRRALGRNLLVAWAAERAKLGDWLFGECYDAVGDLAETIHLVAGPSPHPIYQPLTWWVEDFLPRLAEAGDAEKKRLFFEALDGLAGVERFVFLKLLTGAFRVGVSRQLVLKGLAQAHDLDPKVLAHRLMGSWRPGAESFRALLSPESQAADPAQPYPFFLAHPIEEGPETLGSLTDWLAEWKWDGIRAQLVRRGKEAHLWTRGEELVSEHYPEISQAAGKLAPGTVLDGEILPFVGETPLGFAALQKRIGLKSVSKRILAEVPVIFMAYDLLEWQGADARATPLDERRALLETALKPFGPGAALRLSPRVMASDWTALDQWRQSSRERGVEGLMLKRRLSPYGTGRQRGDWWKWKIDPLSFDGVLIYAQRGSGKRAGLHTDYTLGVWHQGELTPVAKAYSGLTQAELVEVDDFIRAHTREKFGPVRTVEPQLVMEIAFEAIQKSPRHRSGIAVRFPRIVRWRRDKTPADADTLENLARLIPNRPPPQGQSPPGSRQGELFDNL